MAHRWCNRETRPAYANPAALAGLRGLHFIFGANTIADGRQFQRDNLLTVDGQPYEVQFEDAAFQKVV